MSRKDYILFAKAISENPDAIERKIIAELVARVCLQDNPRFDYKLFMTACKTDIF